MENEILYLKLDDIIPNRFQPREIFDEELLNKLADSIKQHGVIEPIIVRPVSNKYEIIAGERRYKASVLAGLTKIPAIVKQYDDKESSIVAYIENEHRSGVSAIEEARTINRLLKSNDITQEELAKELGISQSTLANKLRLLNLPIEVQDALMHNEISERHARSLLSVKDEDKQIELLRRIKERKMTVRELDSEISNMNNGNMYNEYNNLGANNPVPPMPANPQENYMNPAPVQEAPQEDQGFMSFLNNYDNNNPLPMDNAPVNNEVSSMSEAPVENNDFMNYLNNYDNNNPVPPMPTNPQENYMNPAPVQEAPQEDQGFMSFLNNYDNNNPLPMDNAPVNNEVPSISEAPVENNDFMNYLNNYDNNNPVPPMPANPQENYMNPAPVQEAPQEDQGFMSFLNNYDNNNPLPMNNAPVNNEVPSISEVPVENNDFMNYLNNYDNNSVSDLPPVENQDLSQYNNMPEVTNDNVLINDVTPPITTAFNANQYVEDNPNYVDITKNTVISSVDEIINKLKVVVDDIKTTSKFKIDTDEINYDDLYQITIKIDKRDF